MIGIQSPMCSDPISPETFLVGVLRTTGEPLRSTNKQTDMVRQEEEGSPEAYPTTIPQP